MGETRDITAFTGAYIRRITTREVEIARKNCGISNICIEDNHSTRVYFVSLEP